jgi:ABC-type transport system involved in cytochrome c biogenesis ATPase subunit
LKALLRRRHREVRAVDSISFEIENGEVVGFLGPNGAGKTTTLKMLSGLLYPSSGEAAVLGRTPSRREKDYLRQITLVMGNRNQLQWDLPALDSFELNRAIYRLGRDDFKRTRDELVDLLDVGDLVRKPVRNLSLGERMKVEIVGALLHRPQVLFRDSRRSGWTSRCRSGSAPFSPSTTSATARRRTRIAARPKDRDVEGNGAAPREARGARPNGAGSADRGRDRDRLRAGDSRDGVRAGGRRVNAVTAPAQEGRLRALADFYVATARAAIATQFQYRVAQYFDMLGMIAEPVIYLVVWSSVARSSGGAVNGITAGEFAAYYRRLTAVSAGPPRALPMGQRVRETRGGGLGRAKRRLRVGCRAPSARRLRSLLRR